jgi:hypothetical protein
MADTLGLLDDISQRLDQLLAADPLDDPDTVAADALVAAMDLGTKLDAVCARLAARVESSGVWRSDGSRSASAWLGRHCGRHRGECRTALRRGQLLTALPAVAAAFEAGAIGAWHVDQIARLYRRHQRVSGHGVGVVERIGRQQLVEAL